jgi:hypothetical protein
MASEQVRQASKVIGPLLRRRGTSTALGAALRRALGALDKSLSGLDGPKQEEAEQAGIAELRACVGLIEASDRPADHGQLEGLNKALGILAPPEARAPEEQANAIAGPISLPDSETTAPPPAQPGGVAKTGRKRRPRRAPKLDFQTVDAQLLAFAAKLDLLHVVLTEPLFRLADADAASAELHRHIQTMRWLGGDRVQEILRAIDKAERAEEGLVAGAALVHLGADRGVEWLMAILDKTATSKRPLPRNLAPLLSTLASADFLDAAFKAILKPSKPALCAILVPLLSQKGLLPHELLSDLVKHPSDEIAIPAAHALAFAEASHVTPLLLSWVGKARTVKRANALLFAAVGLGSAAALTEVRTRLDNDAAYDPQLVDALAVGGGRADARRLITLAARPEADASYAVLAAAHLGCAETLEALPSLAECVPAEVLDEARHMISGVDPVPDIQGKVAASSLRSLRGKPWSVSVVLDRLAASDEPVQSQQRLALELRVRTGLSAPTVLPTVASRDEREKLVAQWSAHFAKANGRLAPGDWYYQGKPERTAPPGFNS